MIKINNIIIYTIILHNNIYIILYTCIHAFINITIIININTYIHIIYINIYLFVIIFGVNI